VQCALIDWQWDLSSRCVDWCFFVIKFCWCLRTVANSDWPLRPDLCCREFWWRQMWRERSESSVTCRAAQVSLKTLSKCYHTLKLDGKGLNMLLTHSVWSWQHLTCLQKWESAWMRSSASGSQSSEVNTHTQVIRSGNNYHLLPLTQTENKRHQWFMPKSVVLKSRRRFKVCVFSDLLISWINVTEFLWNKASTKP